MCTLCLTCVCSVFLFEVLNMEPRASHWLATHLTTDHPSIWFKTPGQKTNLVLQGPWEAALLSSEESQSRSSPGEVEVALEPGFLPPQIIITFPQTSIFYEH